MTRIMGVLGVLVTALAVSVPVALADGGAQKGDKGSERSAVRCAQAAFGGKIVRVGVDALGVRAVLSESGNPLVVRLTAETVIKESGEAVAPAALVVGKIGRFYARVCKRDDRRVITARLILLAPASEPAGEPKTPPVSQEPPVIEGSTAPKPAEDACFTADLNTKIVAISDSSITILRTTSEGSKELKITVNGDTAVRKNDEVVSLGVLKVGDSVHLNIVYCKSGSVRALRILFLNA